MPIYEYTCSQCGKEFEALVLKIGGTLEMTCKHCGSKDVTEKVSAFASLSGSSSGTGPLCAPTGG